MKYKNVSNKDKKDRITILKLVIKESGINENSLVRIYNSSQENSDSFAKSRYEQLCKIGLLITFVHQKHTNIPRLAAVLI